MSAYQESLLPNSIFARLGQIPAVYINAVAVTVGVAGLEVILSQCAGQHFAQLALSGAICASLADVPGTCTRIGRRVAVAAVFSVLAALIVEAFRPFPIALGLGVMLIGLASIMTTSWGAWAGALSYAPLLSIVFAMATPENATQPWNAAIGSAVGGGLYVAWAIASNWALERRYASLALAEAITSTANLFRIRASLLESAHSSGTPIGAMQAWVRGEVALASNLQEARDFLLTQSETARPRRNIAILLKLVELRDILLASRLDLDLLGVDAPGREVLRAIARSLQEIGGTLDRASAQIKGQTFDGTGGATVPDGPEQLRSTTTGFGDSRQHLLPSIRARLTGLALAANDIGDILRGVPHTMQAQPHELRKLASSETLALSSLTTEFRVASPIFRHATRTACAIGMAYLVGRLLPWASHPQWLILTVAVVLRGSLDQTLARRNSRILGTLLGCAVVAGISVFKQEHVLELFFLLAFGVAHAFITLRYWLTAVAATVMALLQTHLLFPMAGFPVWERAADTVLGALIAWSFSYVLPSWERRCLPDALARAMRAMYGYASHVLRVGVDDDVALRLARRQAYDSLSAISAAMERSGAEPTSVQIPLREVATMLDYAQRLMAHISIVRILLASGDAQLLDPRVANQLEDATVTLRTALCDGLDPSDLVEHSGPDEQLSSLPDVNPGDSLLPWIKRRLAILASDAYNTRSAALSTLQRLEATS